MECSEVKVKVTQNKTTPVKYRYLKNVLKYSNEVVVLRYWPPLPKTNYILCVSTTETSESSANVRRTSRGYAPLFGRDTWAQRARWSHWAQPHVSKISKAHFQIGAVFINKPQIWVLNNYILVWNTRVQCRQALAVVCGVDMVLLTYREETKRPRRPIAGLLLLEFSPNYIPCL